MDVATRNKNKSKRIKMRKVWPLTKWESVKVALRVSSAQSQGINDGDLFGTSAFRKKRVFLPYNGREKMFNDLKNLLNYQLVSLAKDVFLNALKDIEWLKR